MTRGWLSGPLTIALGLLAVTPTRGGDAPGSTARAAQFQAIQAEWKAAEQACEKAVEAVQTEAEAQRIYETKYPDTLAFSRRMLDFAAAGPGDEPARDALLWVLERSLSMAGPGPFVDLEARAGTMLLEHHADDPEVARMALDLSRSASRNRDSLLGGLAEKAQNREAKGLARLALAKSMAAKAETAERLGTADRERIAKYFGEPYAAQLRACDPAALRREAERLCDRVIADSGDVRFSTRGDRGLAELLRAKPPAEAADPAEKKRLLAIERRLARKETLAHAAGDVLEELRTLIVGKPAPEIDGVDLEGKPLKLSDHRGKVVVLVFWGSWCGPCMAEVPHERKLVERLKGRPFALLGVDCDGDRAAAQAAIEEGRINWRNWNDGDPPDGPIVARYHVRAVPSTFVLDAGGIIRFKNVHEESLDRAVDALLAEPAARASRP